ncbi:PIN domain-containing protein [Candidatus Woesearchaeota archaeon]|nr:PIN domain-containing protein [Candidatus Woesearchaeota archaeon]
MNSDNPVIVPDTSVIVEGLISKKIESKELKLKTILIHEAVLAELENQANMGRETGYLGIEEVKKLRDISSKQKFSIEFRGKRPAEFEIKRAKAGEIDNIIRNLAEEENATLITADRVQGLVAESRGITTILIEFEKKARKIRLEEFFDDTTMSVHIRENTVPSAKKGQPGKWDFVTISRKELSREEIREISKEIIEEAGLREDGFIEIQRKGSTIVQLGRYRIVITRPPFADGYEITAVRPIKKMTIAEYELSEKLKQRISVQAEGMLIAGSPGMGKSTFAQALAEHFADQEKIVKTVEAPRDLQLPDSITQYAISHGSSQEIHDILLLSRPDYTIFDEMRNTEDFRLFSDLRLAGVGMVGVVHATNPIDAIQRFIGRIELGVIPQVIDTVIFIMDGKVSKVFNIKMSVKVPSGMTEADLARPVVTVHDFETGKLEFEMYSYGEETVVIPVKADHSSPLQKLASESIMREMSRYSEDIVIDMVSDNKAVVYVPEHEIAGIIGKKGQNIDFIEKRLGVNLDIRSKSSDKDNIKKDICEYEAQIGKKNIVFFLMEKDKNKDVDILVNGEYLLTAKSSKKAIIKIKKDNKIGSIIIDALNSSEDVRLVC